MAALELPEKARKQFLAEGIDDHGFGAKKKAKTQEAIDSVKEFWLRDYLLQLKENNLEGFLQ